MLRRSHVYERQNVHVEFLPALPQDHLWNLCFRLLLEPFGQVAFFVPPCFVHSGSERHVHNGVLG